MLSVEAEVRVTCLDMIHRLAHRDPRVLYIGSDPGAGTLAAMRDELPGQHLIEGIAEAHVVGMAAGLAFEGFVPYVNTIATFLTRRCYEQVAIDVCLHDIPVRLIGNGGGLVYAPLGPTHVALEDIAIMRALPNMTVVCPCDAEEMTRLMEASLDWPSPIYIRLGRGGDPIVSRPENGFALGRAIPLRSGRDVLLVSTGTMTQRALAAAGQLAEGGVDAGVVHVHTVKPLDGRHLADLAADARLVVTVEEHMRSGGLGGAVLEALADLGVAVPVQRLGIDDRFLHAYGSQDQLLQLCGLDARGIAERVAARCSASAAGGA